MAISEKLINGQAIIRYKRHRLTASVAYVTTFTYASTVDQWPMGSLCSSVGHFIKN